MAHRKTHVQSGVRKILELPWVYNTFATVIGGNESRKKHFRKYLISDKVKTILDIGCGTAVLLNHLDSDVEYHGCDMEQKYIDHCKTKFGDRGNFYLERVGEIIREEWLNKFDAINAHGLLHHLSDEDGEDLLKTSRKYLKKGGFLLTADPVFFDGQGVFSKWIVSKDRGQNVRTPASYNALANKYFNRLETDLIKKNNKLYYSTYAMKMYKES